MGRTARGNVGEIIDGHVHVWQLDRRPQSWIDPVSMAVLHRDHLVGELVHELARHAVFGAVLVQVLNVTEETEEYLWTAAATSQIVGVVGWVDLTAPDVGAALDRLVEHPSGARLLGVRHQALAEPDPAGWLRRVSETAALSELTRRGLACDLMVGAAHLNTVSEVAGRHSEATFVLDHAGKPPIASGWSSDVSAAWARAISSLARHQSVVVKLSGLTTVADPERWQADDLRPYVDHLLEQFGPERLVYGSDWPVSRRAGEYGRTLAAVLELVEELADHERRALLGGTARRAYRLDVPGPTAERPRQGWPPSTVRSEPVV